MFGAFTEDFIAAPLTEQIFHFFIPALADRRHAFPFEAFLGALGASACSSSSSSLGPSSSHRQAPWLFYFVLSVGENCLGECVGVWLEGALSLKGVGVSFNVSGALMFLLLRATSCLNV